MVGTRIDVGPEWLRVASEWQAAGQRELVLEAARKAVAPVMRDALASARRNLARARPRDGEPNLYRSAGLADLLDNSLDILEADRPRSFLVRVWSDPRQMPDGMKSLAAYTDGQGRWRHPVFGRSSTWVSQDDWGDWFSRAVGPPGRRARRDVATALDEVAARLNRA